MFDLRALLAKWRPPRPTTHLTARKGAGDRVLLFVHGLGSNAQSTWGNLFAVCRADPNLDDYTLAVYEYPTEKIRLPLQPRALTLIDLAQGLKTEIAARYSGKEVILVGHSMGGLVIRQYLVSELERDPDGSALQAFLYAVPNRGALAALAAAAISANNRHVEFLRPDDEILRRLDADWERLKVPSKLRVRHVVAGLDEVVSPASAQPVGGGDYDMLATFDHTSIVQATEPDDIRYMVLKRFLEHGNPTAQAQQPGQQIAPDPLFDIYAPQNEPYYIARASDVHLARAIAAGNVWIEGPSGTGKTAALTRGVQNNGWRLIQIMLGAYGPIGPVGLLRAMCAEFASLLGRPLALPLEADVPSLIGEFRLLAREFPSTVIGVLVEEIPLKSDEHDEFCKLMLALAQSLGTDEGTSGRVLLFFSSVDRIASTAQCGPKFLERIGVLQFDYWDVADILKLVDLLAEEFRPALSAAERALIAESAQGSARFVKAVFRRWRNGTAENLRLSRVLEQVKVEVWG